MPVWIFRAEKWELQQMIHKKKTTFGGECKNVKLFYVDSPWSIVDRQDGPSTLTIDQNTCKV